MCCKMLSYDCEEEKFALPKKFVGKIVEVTTKGSKNVPDFLGHLPRAAQFSLVEIQMKPLVKADTLD